MGLLRNARETVATLKLLGGLRVFAIVGVQAFTVDDEA